MKNYNSELYLLAKISSFIARNNLIQVKKLILEYKEYKFRPLKLYETILQCYLFCGFPAAIESAKLFKNYFTEFKFPINKYKYKQHYSSGKINCNLIYKNNFKKLIDNMTNISPDLKDWMIYEGYGKVLGRKGLNLREREIINVTILCARYFEVQLYSHLKGCLNIGISKEELKHIVGSFYDFISKANVNKCRILLNKMLTS